MREYVYVIGGETRNGFTGTVERMNVHKDTEDWIWENLGTIRSDEGIPNPLCLSYVIPHPSEDKMLLLGGEEGEGFASDKVASLSICPPCTW
jgi:N-acetylneuraminic acid mutarotase